MGGLYGLMPEVVILTDRGRIMSPSDLVVTAEVKFHVTKEDSKKIDKMIVTLSQVIRKHWTRMFHATRTEGAMKSRSIATRGAVMLALVGCLLGAWCGACPNDGSVLVPCRLSSTTKSRPISSCCSTTPAVWLIGPAIRPGAVYWRSGGTTPVVQDFVATSSYSGFFDSLSCYTYDAANTRFDFAAAKATLNAACSVISMGREFSQLGRLPTVRCPQESHVGRGLLWSRAADRHMPAQRDAGENYEHVTGAFFELGDGHDTTKCDSQRGANWVHWTGVPDGCHPRSWQPHLDPFAGRD